MADSIQIPTDLTKTVDIKIVDASGPLRNFLVDLANRVNVLERDNTLLKNRLSSLESMT